MRVLSNVGKQFRVKGVEFVRFNGDQDGKVDAAVVVRGPDFSGSLEAAADMGVPVVVVAGTEDAAGMECVRIAGECGVPDECILVLRGDKVVDISGKELAPAIRGGIGLSAVLEAVKSAVENNYVPEPVVWVPDSGPGNPPRATRVPEHHPVGEATLPEEGGERPVPVDPVGHPEPGVAGRGSVLAGEEATVVANGGVLSPVLERAGKVIALFQSSPGADSSFVAAGLLKAMGDGVLHLEVGSAPASYVHYGESLDAAIAGGRYAFCDGRGILGADRQGLYEYVVAEVRVPLGNPQVVDEVYRAAHRVVHVVGHSFKDASESVHNVQLWLDSEMKLRLDALVVDRVPESSHVVELYRGNFADRVRMIVGIEKDEDFGALAESLLRG